jgi:sucrose-phosphate synthase
LQTLILGNRDDIDDMAGGGGTVLTTVLKLIDRYDLYGQVAYPKHHKQTDVPHIYRLAAKTKVHFLLHEFDMFLDQKITEFDMFDSGNSQGVFINPALVEPFGLTIIEVRSMTFCEAPHVHLLNWSENLI